MKPMVKKILIGAGAVLGLLLLAGGGYVWSQTSAYASSMDKVYDVPLPDIERSTDPAVIARGEHLVNSLAGCAMTECHGPDLAGGKPVELGPLGVFSGPNVTGAGISLAYSDAELARLILHGLKKDGRSVTFMPTHEINWLPDDDVRAIISYVRSVPEVQKPNGPMQVGTLAKILDRNDQLILDVARRIDHEKRDIAPPPEPTEEYGRYIARLCMGCHGNTFGGGPIPGAPSHIPVPTNITPHETGLKDWSFADFEKLLDEGIKPNGQKLDPFMPIEGLKNLDEVERQALWAFLQSLPPKVFGSR